MGISMILVFHKKCKLFIGSSYDETRRKTPSRIERMRDGDSFAHYFFSGSTAGTPSGKAAAAYSRSSAAP